MMNSVISTNDELGGAHNSCTAVEQDGYDASSDLVISHIIYNQVMLGVMCVFLVHRTCVGSDL